MEDTIQKFVKLPAHIRSAVSSPDAITRLEKIEDNYHVKLADLVMRVTTKELPLSRIQAELENSLHITSDKAVQLKKDLMHNIFSQISNYLGFKPDADPDAGYKDSVIHEASLGVEQKDPEIEHHASKLKYQKSEKLYDVANFANNLLSKNGLSFDHVIQKRFEKLVESRFADVREKADVIDRLKRDTKIGGIGLEGQTAQKVLSEIEEEYARIHALHLKVKTDEPIKSATSPDTKKKEENSHHPPMSQQMHPLVAPSAKPVMQKPEPVKKPESPSVQEPVESKPQEPVKPSLKPQTGSPASQQPAVPQKPSKIPPVSVPPTKAPVVPRLTSQPRVASAPKKPVDIPHFMPKVLREQGGSAKPTMSDIKSPSKLIGPTEELKNMTVKDFRRLGETIDESVNRIKDMVQKLEKESFERRSQGLKAWRSSQLVKQYLEIGQESMEKNKNVSRVISDRQAKGEEVMTSDEFEAIAALNKSLRY